MPRRFFGIRSRTSENAQTRRPTRHLFSRDAVSSTENVRLDEALMGVARNPLRDGAPPTGLCALAHRWGVRPHAAAKAHEAPCRTSSSIGSAMGSTFIRLVTALFTGGLPVGAATDFGIRQNPADYASKTSFECERMSPRAASMRSACNALPRVLAAGLVMPLASPINFRRSGSKRVPRHVMPLSTEREHGILFARLVSPWRRKPSRNSWP